MSDNKRKSAAIDVPDDVDKEHCPKRLKSSAPDCVVIVGGERFYYYSSVLSYGSEYFDTMLGSDMKEGNTKVISFPEKDPEEWMKIYRFFEPAAPIEGIGKWDLSVYVPWFSELQMTDALNRCDEVMKQVILKLEEELPAILCTAITKTKSLKLLKQVMEKTEYCILYGLNRAKRIGLAVLKRYLGEGLVLLDDDSVIERIVTMIKDDITTRHQLFPLIKARLPRNIPKEMKVDDLIASPLLPSMILLAVQLRAAASDY